MGRAFGALVVALVVAANVASAAADDVAAQRWVRVETPLWKRILHAPALLVDAFHWPLKHFLFWGESVRIDRRLRDAILWKDNDDQPVAEPAKNVESEYVWWDVYRQTWLEPIDRVVDLGESVPALGRAAGLVAAAEAANVNALDETPDSTWFTNRHGRRPLSPEELARPALDGSPPAAGPLVVESGKSLGTQPGFWVRDGEGRRYLLKFDPRGYPDLATGAEVLSSRILYVLGWNVARYDSILLDPERLRIDDGAVRYDEYHRRRALTSAWLAQVLAGAEETAPHALRAAASEEIGGVAKGGFSMAGVRADDPNDTVPHEDRRDLRGLRVVAAWLDHVDFRTGNTLDAFVRGPGDAAGRGHLVHYLVDLNGTLGSWGTGWKAPWMGREGVTEFLPAIARGLHLAHPAWADARPGPAAVGYFEGAHFDPERWKPLYPAPPFERATLRDCFWGARLVASLTEADLRTLVASVPWSDPAAAEELLAILCERRKAIAKTYFDARRLNPLDRPEIDGGDLRLRDLSVWTAVVDPARARYRATIAGRSIESDQPRFALAPGAASQTLEIETSHDDGRSWSPPLRVAVVETGAEGARVAALERVTR